MKLQAFVMPLLDVIVGISSVIALLYGGKLVLSGTLSPGQFVSFTSYVGMLAWPMIAVGDSINSFSQGFASKKRVEAIFAEEAEIVDGAHVKREIEDLRGEISVKHLTFAYNKEAAPALKDLSVSIKRGETLAILGRTGSGKTTFANLLVRMYDVGEGQILMIISFFPIHCRPISRLV